MQFNWRGLTAIGFIFLGQAFFSGSVWAQSPSSSSSWAGPYLGVFGGLAQAGSIHGSITPYRYPGYAVDDFAGPVAPIVGDEFSKPFGAPGVRGGLRATYLWDVGRLVAGVDAQFQFGHAVRVAETISSIYAGPLNLCGLGCLSGTATDDLSVKASVSWSAALRARAGLPIGEATLLSAFAGPAILDARVTAHQASNATSFVLGFDPYQPTEGYDLPLTGSAAGAATRALIGGVVGGSVDYRLSEHWILSAEASVSIFQPLKLNLSEGGGAFTTVSYRPVLPAVNFGLGYKF
jgi:hypothetical protein